MTTPFVHQSWTFTPFLYKRVLSTLVGLHTHFIFWSCALCSPFLPQWTTLGQTPLEAYDIIKSIQAANVGALFASCHLWWMVSIKQSPEEICKCPELSPSPSPSPWWRGTWLSRSVRSQASLHVCTMLLSCELEHSGHCVHIVHFSSHVHMCNFSQKNLGNLVTQVQ